MRMQTTQTMHAMQMTHVEHGFGPVWDAHSRVLVLGSMPSPKSRDAGFYYMHRFNRFWPVMAAIFRDDSCLPATDSTAGSAWPSSPDEIAELVKARRTFALRHGLALWDVIASCDIAGASDASIRNAVPNDIPSIVRGSGITHVFTTGAKAAQLYRRLVAPMMASAGLDGVALTTLPSTSPANAGMSLDRLIEAYRPIAAVS